MKPKTMILMGLAITCGLGASWMTSRLIAGRDTPSEETVNILVAHKVVSVGELLKKPEDYFVFKAVSVKDIPDGAIREPDAIKDKIMKRTLRKGDHITVNEMYNKEEQLDIPEGHLAIGLKVNIESSVSGFASLPRSRVDVLLTVRVNGNDINQSFVQVLIEDVLVLAADTDTTREKGIVASAAVVTMALTPDDAKRVAGAKEMGTLSLALRKPGDHSRTDRPVMTFAEIKASKHSNEAPKPSPEAPPAVAKDTVPPDAEKAPAVKENDNQPGGVEPAVPPTVITKTLTITNGKKVETAQFHYTEDGQPVEDSQLNPAPAPEGNSARPQGSPSRARRNSSGDF